MSIHHAANRGLQQAMSWHQQGLLDKAKPVYEDALKLGPNNAQAWHLLGVLHAQQNRHPEAVQMIGRAIRLDAQQAHFHNNLGLALLALKKQQSSQQCFERALALQPNFFQAHANLGICLQAQGCVQAAISSFNRSLALKPDYAEAYFGRGNSLHALGDLSAALTSYDHAIAHQPHYPEAYCNRGLVFKDLRRFEESVESFSKAIKQQPEFTQAYGNRGNVLRELHQLDAAMADYNRAIAIDPAFADSYANRASVFNQLGYLNDALANCRRAIALKPDFPEAHCNEGEVLIKLGRPEEAIQSLQEALRLRPAFHYLFGGLLHMRMKLCEWSQFGASKDQVLTRLKNDEQTTGAFPVLSLTDDLALQRQAAQIWMRDKCPANPGLGALPVRMPGTKIRIGYFSADFHNHATMYLMAQVFERHDRNRFELVAFSFGPDKQDAMRARAIAVFDQFLDVRTRSDEAVAALSRELGIDIAVDLKGYTEYERTGIFACRAAPIQVNYLGYPGTMGAPFIDYLIADPVLIPAQARVHYTEKIAYLPHSYQPNDTHRIIADRVFTREELGLPEKGFVFCCFNSSYKITPQVFDVWVRILQQVPGSVLWLFKEHAATELNLRREAVQRGLDPARLVFAPRMELAEHLARHRQADLFLDTLPYNAHTTASDALWTGLPVLTCMGQSMASRVAASLLHALGLPELVTQTEQDYEALAVSLAQTPDKLRTLCTKLQENRLTAPLFDTDMFTHDIERLYTRMHTRHLQGLPCEHLETTGIPSSKKYD